MESVRKSNNFCPDPFYPKWKIVKVQFPIVNIDHTEHGLAGHNFIVIKDEHDNVIAEFHGLATDPDTGDIIPIGFFGKKLRYYKFNDQMFYKKGQKEVIIFEGIKPRVEEYIQLIEMAGSEINTLNLDYPFAGLGENSNSVASTLIAATGLGELILIHL